MTHFRMQHAVDQAPFHHSAAANSGTHGDVDESGDSLGCAPSMLAERRRVDVGVEGDREFESAADRTGQIHVPPAGLGCRGNETEVRRRGVQVDWSERGNADRGERIALGLLAEEFDHTPEGLLG